MPVVHLTAKMRPPHALFWEFDHASWFWERMREGYPGVLGLCLMPDHPHLLADVEDPEAARARFVRTCGHLQRRAGVPNLWEPVPRAEVIIGRQKLIRSVRYLALNPPRKNLCGDPLEWWWSTHRDVVGAVARPLVTAGKVARITRVWRARSAKWLHGYCSGDPSVRVEGTAFPQAAVFEGVASHPLAELAAAAIMATRSDPRRLDTRGEHRTLFVWLARAFGWNDAVVVGRVCGLSANAVRRAWRGRAPTGLDAATLCLGDARLLRPPERPSCGR